MPAPPGDRGASMSDVFISYARSTSAQAQQVADALRGLGYDVWRDDDLPAHRSYAEVIDERLRAARAVVVIWSADAAKSQWVRAEADLARQAGTLVQLRIDELIAALQPDRVRRPQRLERRPPGPRLAQGGGERRRPGARTRAAA